MKEKLKLKRDLGFALLVFYGLGNILGAGIYVLVGKVAGVAGYYAPFAFVVSAVVAYFTALSYAELSARYPFSSGEALYVQKGFNKRWYCRHRFRRRQGYDRGRGRGYCNGAEYVEGERSGCRSRFQGVWPDSSFPGRGNAGVSWPTPLGQIDASAVVQQMAINFVGPPMMVQALRPVLNRGASVFFTTSNLDRMGMPRLAVYSASKAALRTLARTLAAELVG